MLLSVTIAICTHNGESLLPETLTHIKRQRIADGLRWELLVIDNASSDATALVARQYWGEDGPAPLRVVHEPRVGLCYARERAFSEAHCEVVSFVDDDNWIRPEFVTIVSECMSADPDLGAIGSTNTAVADTALPEWFSRWAHYYAAHASCEFATLESWILVGAGMTIRKRCWEDLWGNGFRPRLTDRVGPSLTTCGDLELGCAIQLAGWTIRVEPRLGLLHYMTGHRLQWRYLRRLARKTGEAMTVLDSYFFFSREQKGLKGWLRRYWWAHLIRESLRLAREYSAAGFIRSFFQESEGVDDVVYAELRLGRLIGLLRLRSRYALFHREVAQARWRRTKLAQEPFDQGG
jgi:glycosyltransferase involved in cell wall biosynthesis